MALKRRLGAALLAFSLTWACRSVSVCSGPSCAVEPTQNDAGGVAATGAGATAGEPDAMNESGAAGATERMLEAGGQGGAAGAGGDGGAQEARPPACNLGWGDCDGSTLNGCESNLQLSVRHCGACGNSCAGLCLAGTCKEAEQLFVDGSPRNRVATQSALFTVMANFSGDRRTLFMFDLTSGESTALFELSGYEPTLSLGNDHVYVKDGAGVVAISFDGERVTPVMGPDGPLSAWYFGATSAGLYYVDSDDDSVVWTVNYRANQASDWHVIYEGGPLELMSAGPEAIALLSGDWTSEDRELMLARNGELTTVGVVPNDWSDIDVYEDRIAVITGTSELWWYRAADEQPETQAIPSDFYYNETLVPAPEGLAVMSHVGSETLVQCYAPGGTSWIPVGISRDATLVFVNRTHLWYLLMPSPIDPPLLMRARLFEHDDL